MKKYIALVVLTIILLTTIIFSKQEASNYVKSLNQYTLWAAYWDLENFEYEIDMIYENIDAVSHFAAYFNHENNLFIPNESLLNYDKVKNNSNYNFKNYLSFVNDISYNDGSSSLKDTDVLYAHLKEPLKHVDDIIELTIKHGFDGIEIDYENIKDDLELWNIFTNFIQDLYVQSEKHDLELRVVLEPSVPSKQINLPLGPKYVLMAYNLHGHGTLPGPKANKNFLNKLVLKKEEIPGDLNFALAMGGFDFSNEKVIAISEEKANELIEVYNVRTKRDSNSQALYFTYTDESNIHHEVWFSDSVTIKHWIKTLENKEINEFSLWKMGGNLNLNSIIK